VLVSISRDGAGEDDDWLKSVKLEATPDGIWVEGFEP